MSGGAIPEKTTPTWEMELLISGATIFGLLQMPAWIDRAYLRTLNASADDYAGMLTPLWMYSKFGVVTLMMTFIVHLCLRGYWVALVGMDSVYPGGVRWNRLEKGPISRASSERDTPTMPELIERADNRATRVFGIGFGFAMVMLLPVAVVLLGLGISVVVDALAGPGHAGTVSGYVIFVLMVPWATALLVDRQFGSKLSPDRGLGRLLARVLAFYGRLGLGRGSNPLVALFVSHEGRTRSGWVGALLSIPVVAVLLAQMGGVGGAMPFGSSVGLPGNDPTSVAASPVAFYRDSGNSENGVLPLPRIPTRIAQGPYVELFVPFVPRLHVPAMRAACPKVLQASTDESRLLCLAQLADIRIDGQPVPLRLDASTDPDTGQPGALAMLPVATLATGRHEISLNQPTRPGQPKPRYRIAFWK